MIIQNLTFNNESYTIVDDTIFLNDLETDWFLDIFKEENETSIYESLTLKNRKDKDPYSGYMTTRGNVENISLQSFVDIISTIKKQESLN